MDVKRQDAELKGSLLLSIQAVIEGSRRCSATSFFLSEIVVTTSTEKVERKQGTQFLISFKSLI